MTNKMRVDKLLQVIFFFVLKAILRLIEAKSHYIYYRPVQKLICHIFQCTDILVTIKFKDFFFNLFIKQV